MTREEKIAKRKARAKRRHKSKKNEWNKILHIADVKGIPVKAARQYVRHGYIPPWSDPDSPTGYTQVCDWAGTCQSPCNGDC